MTFEQVQKILGGRGTRMAGGKRAYRQFQADPYEWRLGSGIAMIDVYNGRVCGKSSSGIED